MAGSVGLLTYFPTEVGDVLVGVEFVSGDQMCHLELFDWIDDDKMGGMREPRGGVSLFLFNAGVHC